MANDYYDNSTPAERFQAGVTARGSEVDGKFDAVEAAFDKLPGVAATGKGFNEPIHVGNATSGTHAVPLEQALDKVAEWVNASIYNAANEYSFSDIVIGSDGLTYRFVGASPATGDDPVTSNTGNWAGYGGGGVAELGTLTASMTNGQTTSINLSDDVITPIVTATKEVIDTGLTNSDWNVDATGTNYEIEDSAYPTTLTPSATTGTITLALGAGAFTADDVGKRIVGNGGEAVITATSGSALVVTDFASTATIASGSWQMHSLEKTTQLNLAKEQTGSISDVVFESASTSESSATTLNNGNVLIAYRDAGNSNYGTFVVYDASGTQVVAPTVFNSALTVFISATALDNGNALIAYRDSGNSLFGTLVVYGPTGTQVVAPTVFESAQTNEISATTLTNGNVMIAYTDAGNTNFGTLVVYGPTGTQVVAPTVFESAVTANISATPLTNGNVLIAYTDGGNSSFGTFVIYDPSGTQVVAPTVFESAPSAEISATTLNNGDAMIAYKDGGNTDYGTLVVYGPTGTQVVAPTVFESASTSFISATTLTNGNVMIAYTDVGNGSFGTFVVYDSTGTQVVAPTVFEQASASNISVASLDSSETLIAYTDVGNGSFGTFRRFDSTGTEIVDPIYSYLANQHAAAVTNAVGQINTEFWLDINSLTATEALDGQSIHYAISTDSRVTWQIAKAGSLARNIVRNNAGTWQYNADNTYGGTSWFDATVNTEFGALSQAMSVTANQMTGTQAGALGDADIPATTNTLDLAVILFTNDASAGPTSDGLSINYDANATDSLAVPGTDYEWDHPDLTTVRFTSLGNFNIKARVVG